MINSSTNNSKHMPDNELKAGKGVTLSINTGSFMRSTLTHKEPVEIVPTTQQDKQIMTDICTAEINVFIRNAKEDGNFLNAKSISDGYHTFQELYDMRLALTVALFSEYNSTCSEGGNAGMVWRSKQHSDGTMFDGMFIVGIDWEDSFHTQFNDPMIKKAWVTFHYHDEHWDKFYFCRTLDKAPEWDGHTDKDVIERLLAL